MGHIIRRDVTIDAEITVWNCEASPENIRCWLIFHRGFRPIKAIELAVSGYQVSPRPYNASAEFSAGGECGSVQFYASG